MQRLAGLILVIGIIAYAYGLHCQVPRLPDGGELYFDTSTGYVLYEDDWVPTNKYLKLKCEANHIIEGDPIIRCLEDGSWSALPNCARKCTLLMNTAADAKCWFNGKLVNCAGAEGLQITHMDGCIQKSEKLQNDWNTCDKSRWTCSMASWKCDTNALKSNSTQIKHCQVPQRPNGGKFYSYPSTGHVWYKGHNVSTNTYLKLVCEANYKIKGKSIMQCKEDGTWSHSPKCQIIKHCQVPERPFGGECYLDTSTGHVCYEGQMVSINTYLKLECQANHAIKGDPIILCMNDGTWSNSPKCDEMCPPPKGATVMITCILNNKKVDCTGAQRHGTIFWAVCRAKHYNVKNDQSVCYKGRWTKQMPSCKNECGELPPSEATALINNGKEARMFPWHALVYTTNKDGTAYELICGGTLINNRFIISAAHCFYDKRDKIENPAYFFVEMGKRIIEQGLEKDNQYVLKELAVEEIMVPKEYGGYGRNLESNIALVKLHDRIELNQYVLPICFTDKDHPADKIFQNRINKTARVAGTGHDENMMPTNELKYLDVPVIDNDVCLKEMPTPFVKYMTSDKLCAGYKNGSSVYQGDSGGGLVFESDDFSSESKWYMLGTVSAGLIDIISGSRTDMYSVFTNIAYHIDWIREQLKKHDYTL